MERFYLVHVAGLNGHVRERFDIRPAGEKPGAVDFLLGDLDLGVVGDVVIHDDLLGEFVERHGQES